MEGHSPIVPPSGSRQRQYPFNDLIKSTGLFYGYNIFMFLIRPTSASSHTTLILFCWRVWPLALHFEFRFYFVLFFSGVPAGICLREFLRLSEFHEFLSIAFFDRCWNIEYFWHFSTTALLTHKYSQTIRDVLAIWYHVFLKLFRLLFVRT